MPRFTKKHFHRLNTYRDDYVITAHSKEHRTSNGATTDHSADAMSQQVFINGLDAVAFFRSLGGTEQLSYTVHPRSLDTIDLRHVSISPDNKTSIVRIYTIKFAEPYKLTNFINL